MFYVLACCFFFFKQKTAYEMRISDWSSDVCSSDLPTFAPAYGNRGRLLQRLEDFRGAIEDFTRELAFDPGAWQAHARRGQCYSKLGQPRSAVLDFNAALIRDRKSTRLNSSH